MEIIKQINGKPVTLIFDRWFIQDRAFIQVTTKSKTHPMLSCFVDKQNKSLSLFSVDKPQELKSIYINGLKLSSIEFTEEEFKQIEIWWDQQQEIFDRWVAYMNNTIKLSGHFLKNVRFM